MSISATVLELFVKIRSGADPPSGARVNLLECCDEALRKDLTRDAGGSLATQPAKDVLSAIKRLALREENAIVAWVTLSHMRQERDEPIRGFGARLKGQAAVCRFPVKCPQCNSDVDYTDQITRDKLIRGESPTVTSNWTSWVRRTSPRASKMSFESSKPRNQANAPRRNFTTSQPPQRRQSATTADRPGNDATHNHRQNHQGPWRVGASKSPGLPVGALRPRPWSPRFPQRTSTGAPCFWTDMSTVRSQPLY